MRNLWILLLICFAGYVNAQDHKIDFPKGTIEIEDFSNVTIEGYDGNQVLIYEYFQENMKPNQSIGLKKINSRSPELDAGLKYKVRGNTLKLTESYSMGSFLIKVPMDLNVLCIGENLHPYGNRNITYTVKGVHGEIEILAMDMVNVVLENNTGPTSVVTHGNIDATYRVLPKLGSLSFDTYRGYVDLSLPKDSGANVKLSARQGDIFTDLNIQKKDQTTNPEHLFGTINNGGIDLIINAQIGGNIYLRVL